MVPQAEVLPGTATVIATGGMVPRGADAVVMVEHTHVAGATVQVLRPVAPGTAISFAGSDIGRGEIVLRQGEWLGSRETGVLAALGLARVPVYGRPRVAILSTGDEHRTRRGPNAAGACVRLQRDYLGRRSKGDGRGARGSGDRA